MSTSGEITRQLAALRRGDRGAESQLAELVYHDLRLRARQYMRRERPDHTLRPTALVNEAFMKLMRGQPVEWQSRAHFLAVASSVMRQVLIDHARGHAAQKRPGGKKQVELTDAAAAEEPRIQQLLILDEALGRLAEMDSRQARIVELIYFGGLSMEETAEVLSISTRTVKRDWAAARAWLQTQLRSEPE